MSDGGASVSASEGPGGRGGRGVGGPRTGGRQGPNTDGFDPFTDDSIIMSEEPKSDFSAPGEGYMPTGSPFS